MADIVVKTHKKDENKFHFCGVMVGKSGTAATRTVTMRVATKHNNKLYINHPFILAFDQNVQEKVETIPLRVPVIVDGYITSRKPDDHSKDTKTFFDRPLQTFIMTDIRVANEDEKENKNEVDIIGNVEKAYVGKGRVIHFIIATIREGHYLKRIKVDLFPKDDSDYQELVNMMIAGTKLHVSGHCSTVSQETEHGQRHLEFIVADNVEYA